ncbi:cofilin [Tephrocybe rancida]|nr:cofilin [Tephrocybe rancida]
MASASGVGVNSLCLEQYQALKLKKTFKYIIFTLSKDNTEIVIEKTSVSQEYDDFIADLPETECRWAVYDFEFEKEGSGKRNKLTFVSWSPDDAKIKQKMLFASSKEALRRSLVGIAVEIQGTDFSEVAYESDIIDSTYGMPGLSAGRYKVGDAYKDPTPSINHVVDDTNILCTRRVAREFDGEHFVHYLPMKDAVNGVELHLHDD